MLHKWPVVWVNVQGLRNAEIIEQIGSIFNLHRLTLEDITHVHQRAKLEPYEDYLLFILRIVSMQEHLDSQQLSLILGDRFVISFREHGRKSIDEVFERIKNGRGRIRTSGADYLAYAIVDAVVDSYFPIIETYGDHMEKTENRIIAGPDNRSLHEVRRIKRDLLAFRRAVWPLREAINMFSRHDMPFVSDATRVYLRDCYDHIIQVIDMVETYRELSSGLMDTYMSSVGNRMNEIMKVLGVFATIFIPLTFIAGVYGMNFNPDASPWNMPELNWKYGYPVCLTVMLIMAMGMLFYFRSRGWIGQRNMLPADDHSDEVP
jgi:magnesium transporter